MRILYISLFSFLLVACSGISKNDSTAKENLNILSPFFFSPIYIYLLADETIDVGSIQAAASKAFPDFTSFDHIPDSIVSNGYMISLSKQGDARFIQPDKTQWVDGFMNLTEQEMSALEHSTRLLELVFFGIRENVIKKQYAINNFVQSTTNGKHVAIVDGSTIEYFNEGSWKELRADNLNPDSINITQQVTIHTYRDGEFCRAVTLGMVKFCLPEISIHNFTCSDQITFGNVINAAIQTLVENPFMSIDSTLTLDLAIIKNATVRNYLMAEPEDGASRRAEIRLRSVIPEEGDNFAPQFLITFENPDFNSPQEEQFKLASDLFGSKESLAYSSHDQDLLDASERAKSRVPELEKMFNDGLAPGYAIMFKKPFPTNDGSNEWMWVEVTQWQGVQMTGILQNDAFDIPGLKAGAIVQFNQSEIFDYILSKPDGSYEGNETGEILEKRN